MTSIPKWTEERTAKLVDFVGDESPVTQETVAEAAEVLETSTRSISSKLRKMDYDVEKAGAHAQGKYTEEQAATLKAFVEANSGEFTYAQIAANFEGGEFSPKSIQGKILSMELTDHVKPAPKVEAKRTFTPEEEALFIQMVNDGAYLEDLAEAFERELNSVRGKALSLLRSEDITDIPKQKHTKSKSVRDPLSEVENVCDLTVEEIAEQIGKTARGVKAMLTRRGLNAKDYKGADRAAKAAKAAEAA